MPRRTTWRYTTGIKGVNRVTVYERLDRPVLYIEYHDGYGQRIQRTIESETGIPLPNTEEGRVLAVKAADRVARDRERAIYREAADAFGAAPIHTVAELLERLHNDKWESWAETYRRDQKRFRTFWEAKIGDATLPRVNAAMVMRVASIAAKSEDWSPRTHGSYLRYIVDAFGYAEGKLKWIEARDNLSAVDIPSPDSEGEEYSIEEVRKLLPALGQVDPRAEWIGHVAFQTGRRLSAVRQMLKRDVTLSKGQAVLRFGKATDKAKKRGEAVVVGRAAELTATLMRKRGVYVLGKEPPTLDLCNDWIREAEDIAEIPHVAKRAWHGLKRSAASATDDLALLSRQSGTRRTTLETVYQKDWRPGKATLAERLAGLATVPAPVPGGPDHHDGETS